MSLSESQFDSSLQNEPSHKDIISKFRRLAKRICCHNYRYVVATTRRASNFLEIARAGYPDILSKYITENGLLLQAEEIARFYKMNECFPKIAILDDILVYGRNMNLLLTQLWSTVSQCLSQLGIDAGEDVEEAFNRSVSLWIYAMNDAPILLRHEFQWTMRCPQMLSNSQWRCLSDSIAKTISDRDVANTSYVISAKLKRGTYHGQPNVMSWVVDDSLRYRDNHYRYSFYLFRLSPKAGVYPSVRSYVKQGFQYFTPYFFMPELNAGQVIRVLLAIFEVSSKQNLRMTNKCINLLNRIKECPSRLMVYAQFTFLLLSQITLSVFFENLDSKMEAQLIYDTEKISRNFEKGMEPILNQFCRIRWNEKQLIAILDCLGFPDRSDMIAPPAAVTELDYQSTVNGVECLVYKQAVDHERDAAGQKQYRPSDAPSEDLHVNRTGEQELGSFLSRVESWAGIQGDIVSMLPVLSCLTQMMDLGDISVKARSKRCNGQTVFYSSVRTTEMSLAIMPRKLSRYYRQFFLLAQLYWRDQDFPDRVEYFFKEMIFGGDPEGKNATMIRNARYFARLISENQMIVDSMLNWRDLPEFREP